MNLQRTTGVVEIDPPTIDQVPRYEAMATAAIAAADAKNGIADAAKANRERLEKAALRELLAAGSPKDRDHLAKERRRLTEIEAEVQSTEAAAGQAREAYILASVAGQSVSERGIDAADAKYAKAKRDRALAQDIVERLEARIIANVRAERHKRAQASLSEIGKRWTAASATVLAAFDAIETLAKLHAAEIEAARDLAASAGALPVRWSTTHERPVPINGFGEQHVRTPNLDLALAIGDQLVTREQMAERLKL